MSKQCSSDLLTNLKAARLHCVRREALCPICYGLVRDRTNRPDIRNFHVHQSHFVMGNNQNYAVSWDFIARIAHRFLPWNILGVYCKLWYNGQFDCRSRQSTISYVEALRIKPGLPAPRSRYPDTATFACYATDVPLVCYRLDSWVHQPRRAIECRRGSLAKYLTNSNLLFIFHGTQ